MYPMLEHPDITSALRTGYPSWIKDLDVDDDEEQDEELEVYYE